MLGKCWMGEDGEENKDEEVTSATSVNHHCC